MTLKRLADPKVVQMKVETKKQRKENKGKDWQNLSTSEKWDIVEGDLRARGLID